MISSILSDKDSVLERNTWPSCFPARISTESGVVIITAPIVPPRTIIAEVIWATSRSRPPSITRPPAIPPMARSSPPMVAKSGLALGSGMEISRGLREKNGPPIQPDPLHDLVRRFQHNQFLVIGQRDQRVRRALDLFDEVGVQYDRGLVQAGDVDHPLKEWGNGAVILRDLLRGCRRRPWIADRAPVHFSRFTLLLQIPSAGQRVGHHVIPFVAGVLVNHVAAIQGVRHVGGSRPPARLSMV